MSVIHPAGALPVAALMLAVVTVVSVMTVSMVATLMDPSKEEVS